MARSILFAAVGFLLFGGCGRPTQPVGPKDGVVSLEASPGNRYVPAGQSTQAVARVAINVAKLDRTGRPPANVALVVDTSGSMEGKPIEDARAAALALFDALSAKDRLAVVVFNSKTETILPSTPIDDADIGDVKKKIRAIKAEGTTDMASGLQAGINEVTAHLDPEGVNRVILLGDGVPNDETPIAAMAESAGTRGVSITALGLGDDYNETLMGRIAQTTGGKFQYVADSSKVTSFFKEEVGRLEKTYARDAWLDIATGPGVHVSDVVGQQYVPTGKGVRVHVGDLALGEKMDVVVKLAVDGRKDGATIELMDAVLRYSEGVGAMQGERRAFVGLHATGDKGKLASGKDANVEDVAAKAQEAADQLEQIRAARASDVPHPSPASPVSPGAGAHVAPQAAPPALVRQQHDSAMQVLQKR
jgi:Ca-activated chloride channel family protein